MKAIRLSELREEKLWPKINGGMVRFGPWVYRPENLTLTCEDLGPAKAASPQGYEIDLETCTSTGQVLDWIAQISRKAPPSYVVGFLVMALDEILNLQGRYCGMGRNVSGLKPAAFATRWKIAPIQKP
jgi:hypothetical protein